MDVKLTTEITYTVSMTETQATNLLRLSRALDVNDIRPEYADVTGTLETLDDLRQALLNAGVKPSPIKDPT